MKKIVCISHSILDDYMSEDKIAVDFTVGHGGDTKYLAEHCREVYGFDILEKAIEEVKKMDLGNHVHLFCESHHNFIKYVQKFDIGIFNFGYFPGDEFGETTKLECSKTAVDVALNCLNKHGVLLLVCYIGHPEGKKEGEYFKTYAKELDPHYFRTFLFEMQNAIDAPFIIGIEKIRNK